MIPKRFMMPFVATLALGALGYADAVADPQPPPRSEAKHLVPPQGGAVSFSEKLAPVAQASSAAIESKFGN
jgi:hypothetical protein